MLQVSNCNQDFFQDIHKTFLEIFVFGKYKSILETPVLK